MTLYLFKKSSKIDNITIPEFLILEMILEGLNALPKGV